MGFFKKRWRCENCNRKYRKNRTECKRCGHTVFQQVQSSRSQRSSSPSSTSPSHVYTTVDDESQSEEWVCDRCKQSHDTEPEKCIVCGRTAFTYYEPPEELELLADQPIADPDKPTVSSIRDVQAYDRKQSPQAGGVSGFFVLKCLLFAVSVWIVLRI